MEPNADAPADNHGWLAALWSAVQRGNHATVKHILDGRNPLLLETICRSPMFRSMCQVAARNDHAETVRVLLLHVPVGVSSAIMTEMMSEAALNDSVCVAQFLCGNMDVNAIERGLTPVIKAADRGSTGVLRVLIHAKSSVHMHGDMPLGTATTPLHRASSGKGKRGILAMQMLLRAGACVDEEDEYAESPLHSAAYVGNARGVALLLRNNADPTLQSQYDGRTPLHVVASYDLAHCVASLVCAKSCLRTLDFRRKTALQIALAGGNTASASVLNRKCLCARCAV